MKAEISLVKLALCGPGDVKKEIEIAQEVVTEWNLQHGEPSPLLKKSVCVICDLN